MLPPIFDSSRKALEVDNDRLEVAQKSAGKKDVSTAASKGSITPDAIHPNLVAESGRRPTGAASSQRVYWPNAASGGIGTNP